MAKEFQFPGKLEWGLLLASTAILAGVCRPIEAHSNTEVAPILVPQPTETVTPPTLSVELHTAIRNYCADITIQGKRQCEEHHH